MKRNSILYKVIFTFLGAAGGFAYWKFVGCSTGSCPIKSVWYLSTLWGAVMGYLLGDLVADIIGKRFGKRDGTV